MIVHRGDARNGGDGYDSVMSSRDWVWWNCEGEGFDDSSGFPSTNI